MRIRLLGPVDVERAGRSLDVGPLQRRAVLAALAVDAGEPVPIDRLTERVWGPQTPEAPRSALYAHVTRLRRFLDGVDDVGSVRLGRRPDGYVLDIPREDVDLHRVGLLCDAGRAPGDGEQTSVAALREAMDLWRGRPLAGLDGYWAVKVRRSVESQLVGVATRWAAEELRLGNAEVVGDRLARVLESQALAEPLVCLQMRALCAMGRSSEALEYYAATRSRIADQLGTEPGAELRELHMAVLRGELDGTSPARPVAPAASPRHVPRQLPADVARLVGREAETARIVTELVPDPGRGSPPMVGLHGVAGVGTSALAVRAAHALADRYPDGQLYVELHGRSPASAPLPPAQVLARLLRALGVAPPDDLTQVGEAAALFRSSVAGRRLLLVLDDAADTEQVLPLLPSVGCCGVLVTSRTPLAGLQDMTQVPVGALSEEESVRLLDVLVGGGRVGAEPAVAAAVAHACEGLPLALRVVAARLVARPGWPLAELRDRLADERRRLDVLELDGAGLRTSVARSYERLSRSSNPAARAAARAFAVLGTGGAREVSRLAVARLLASSESHAEDVLERLVDAQLLQTPAPGTYRMGPLVRLYARERQAAVPPTRATPVPTGWPDLSACRPTVPVQGAAAPRTVAPVGGGPGRRR